MKRALVFATLVDAQTAQEVIDIACGYPRDGVPIGDGIHCDGPTTHAVSIAEYGSGSAITLSGEAEAAVDVETLVASPIDVVGTSELGEAVKPSPIEIAVVEP